MATTHVPVLIVGAGAGGLTASALLARYGVRSLLVEKRDDAAEVVRKARTDRLQIQFVHRNLDHFVREMDRASNRLSFAIVIAALLIGSSMVIQSGIGPHAFGYPAIGVAGFMAAAVLGLGLIVGVLRSGRL